MSSGSHANYSATSFAVSSMPARVASSVSATGPCTTGSREIWGFPAPKACQHILRLCLRQGATLYLQLATNNFLQLQHLGSYGVKKWERGADLLH
jgi:hypothetical protein